MRIYPCAQFRKTLSPEPFFTSDDDNAPESDDYVQFAEVVARWSGFEISTVADEEGNFEFTLPLGENAIDFYRRTGNLVVGWCIHIRGKRPIELVTERIVYEATFPQSGTTCTITPLWAGSHSGIATNTTSDVTWTSEVNEVGDFEIALPTGKGISLLDSTFTHRHNNGTRHYDRANHIP